ncbi:nucleoside recognition domain-containing protein [Denitrobaculum tricleocarpae]|uniref:Spore maturation protein n=1 Tax=Denitrobaculum tricleocarpae TaxID=2591009 RepID=A0A545TXD3_9PROT|nr:nucleoside recognition domain-containing protein [Denitrobaculum tricleocarpae]TQV81888.1 spore maturation protein [Denitrobaculum tricleocarpae]
MNGIFFAIVVIAFTVAGIRQFTWDPRAGGSSPMEVLSIGMIDAAGGAVTLAIGLVGAMALFLGLMKVAEAGGLLTIIAKTLRPLMIRLFPEVPADHPAMGAIVMNLSANALGLGNAATPFGIRAMEELDKLNPNPGTATNAMALFLAINTSSVTLLPTGVIALRAAAGSQDPAGILPTTLFATICSTTIAILVAKLCQNLWPASPGSANADQPAAEARREERVQQEYAQDVRAMAERAEKSTYPFWVSALALATILCLVPVTILFGQSISPWIIPGLMVALLGFGVARRVAIYEVFVEGAKDGFQVALRIIPYLVAILVAVGMFRASGAMELMIEPLGQVTQLFGLPPEALPMALLRPLSGSGAYGILASIIENPAIGPDSYTGYLVSTFQGSTETTFYVLAVYFGAVQIRRIRHALVAALAADATGVAAAIVICTLLYA